MFPSDFVPSEMFPNEMFPSDKNVSKWGMPQYATCDLRHRSRKLSFWICDLRFRMSHIVASCESQVAICDVAYCRKLRIRKSHIEILICDLRIRRSHIRNPNLRYRMSKVAYSFSKPFADLCSRPFSKNKRQTRFNFKQIYLSQKWLWGNSEIKPKRNQKKTFCRLKKDKLSPDQDDLILKHFDRSLNHSKSKSLPRPMTGMTSI